MNYKSEKIFQTLATKPGYSKMDEVSMLDTSNIDALRILSVRISKVN